MEKAYYSIAELAEMFNVKQSTLRYWEKEFAQLSPKRVRNIRYYTPADIEVIKQIRFLLDDQKLTISGAKARLNTNKTDIERKQKMRERLLALKKDLLNFRRELNENDAFGEEVVVK